MSEYEIDWLRRHSNGLIEIEKRINKLEKDFEKWFSVGSCEFNFKGKSLKIIPLLIKIIEVLEEK